MHTFQTLINALCEAGKLSFQGEHYEAKVPVYSGDLWLLFPNDGDSRKMRRLESIALAKKVQLRFYDETITDDNGMVHDSESAHYGATPTFFVMDCTVVSRDEVEDGTVLDDYIDFLVNNVNRADQFGIDFAKHGFTKFEYEGESGFHPGQTDTPESVRALIVAEHGEDVETLSSIDSVGQFDLSFHAWYRIPAKEEEED